MQWRSSYVQWIQRTFIHATYWEVGALLIGNGSARSVHSVVGAGNRSACWMSAAGVLIIPAKEGANDAGHYPGPGRRRRGAHRGGPPGLPQPGHQAGLRRRVGPLREVGRSSWPPVPPCRRRPRRRVPGGQGRRRREAADSPARRGGDLQHPPRRRHGQPGLA